MQAGDEEHMIQVARYDTNKQNVIFHVSYLFSQFFR